MYLTKFSPKCSNFQPQNTNSPPKSLKRSSPPAKVRRPNYTHGEMLCIINEVKKRLDIIAGKLDNKSGVTSERKLKAWQDITEAVNAISSVTRTTTEIKLKYKDMRAQCKMKYSKYLLHQKGTSKSPSSR